MEIFRSLGAAIEAPGPAMEPLADALELAAPPSSSDHLELFSFQLYPYSSVYLGVEGMMGGDARDRVAGFWRVLKQIPPSEPDHLSVLLSAYAGLCEQDRGEQVPGEKAETPWRRLRQTFLWEHLISWLPLYLGKVPAVTQNPFYRKWAELLELALSAEVELLGLPPTVPSALSEEPGLADPNEEGADALIASLLAPARSGLILTRVDLRRLASSLAMGLRAGERRFALEKLLAQDPAGVLEGLAARVGREPDLSPAWGTIATVWNRRRCQSQAALARLAAAAMEQKP